MRIIRRTVLPAVALALALAGCGGTDEAAVETAFHSYHAALLARDFTTACELNAPDTRAELVRTVNLQLPVQAQTCPEALAGLFGTPTVAQRYDGVSRSAQLQDVEVTGDSAVVTWTYDGATGPVDTGLRLIDGQWRLLAVGA